MSINVGILSKKRYLFENFGTLCGKIKQLQKYNNDMVTVRIKKHKNREKKQNFSLKKCILHKKL